MDEIAVYRNEETGMETRVFHHLKGFRVVLIDSDAGEPVTTLDYKGNTVTNAHKAIEKAKEVLK